MFDIKLDFLFVWRRFPFSEFRMHREQYLRERPSGEYGDGNKFLLLMYILPFSCLAKIRSAVRS